MPGKIPFQLRNATPKIGDPPFGQNTKNWEPTTKLGFVIKELIFWLEDIFVNRWEWQLCIHRTLKLAKLAGDVRSPEILVGCFNQFETY